MKMLEDVGSRSFLVTNSVPGCWIVGFMSVLRFATVVLVHRVEKSVSTDANVGRKWRKGSVLIVCISVRIHVRRSFSVGNMFVREGVIMGSVVSALYKGREHALVGRGCMKGCLVMLLCRCVGVLVIRC